MIEIIPNWHPIFVHFTVGLFSISVLFYLLAYFTTYIRFVPQTFVREFEVATRWCLWTAAIITILTVSFGFYAYYTVQHDAVSHAAMTVHRNWALFTAAFIFLLACWSYWRYYKRQAMTFLFLLMLLLTQGLILITAWHGGELVYRYGIGVLSLPKGTEMGHHHDEKKVEQHQH